MGRSQAELLRRRNFTYLQFPWGATTERQKVVKGGRWCDAIRGKAIKKSARNQGERESLN